MIDDKIVEENNTYNQQQEQMQPVDVPMWVSPMPMPPRKKRTWKEKLMSDFGGGMYQTVTKEELKMPQWLIGKSVLFFFIAYFACRYAFGYPQPLDIIMVASISVVLFFYGASGMAKSWMRKRDRTFIKNVFLVGFTIRFLWVCYLYFIFNPVYYGSPLGSEADTGWYMGFARSIADWVSNGFPTSFRYLIKVNSSEIDDVGYPIWLALIYLLTGNISDIFLPYVIKSALGAYCAISIYRVAKRHYGEGVGRIAALFVMLNPNIIYWCGTMMKEAEMVFLCCLFVDKADATLSISSKLGFKQLIPAILIGLALMFFRTALGLVAFMAIFAHIIFVSSKVMSTGKKVIAGILVAIAIFVGLGNRFITQSREHIEKVEAGGQQQNMEWRSTRRGGNSFAKYAGATVFAPLIFTIPFPTFNQANEEQIVQPITSGGSYIRNVLSVFVIMVMILLLVSGEWRKHVFILAFTLGYLLVLVLSGYAQSGRFHMPVWPMIMLFAAYGIQVLRDNKRIKYWYNLVLVLEIVICLGWNWFKLKGRGMI